ncbi:MAG TPA: DNA translocase FtsK 4TM domain-containing protein, partial [Allosphingosinicella sp.]|nr:DNA translocase FtsK 4TM domain-containing protein [Allosphingosinicella sp.]
MAATAARKSGPGRLARWREGARQATKRSSAVLAGVALSLGAVFALVALASYRPSDPSLNTAAGGPAGNWMGAPGAWLSDLLLTLTGPPVGLLLPLVLVIGLRLARGAPAGRWLRSLILTFLGIALIGAAAGLLVGGAVNGLPAGWGGAVGLALANLIDLGLGALGDGGIVQPFRVALIALSAAAGLACCLAGLGLTVEERRWLVTRRLRSAPAEGEPTPAPEARPARAPVVAAPEPRAPVIADRAAPRENARRPLRERQPSLALGDSYTLPSVDLLNPPPPPVNVALDKAALERNARLLESVLEDFSVKGEIVEVRPGPVVTMYELEPASGIKASRVIQLADDIARNMSALSARVATIPGRSVIG